uniref:Uncharacterized protein n=1 Tax=Kalanchoe fedtschenkoi TaxID=63787 RepID=A0A7N0U822_KALFE
MMGRQSGTAPSLDFFSYLLLGRVSCEFSVQPQVSFMPARSPPCPHPIHLNSQPATSQFPEPLF